MRVVLDTNQLVAALVRPPELATLLMAWESAHFVPIASPALIDEYQHVLAYPEIADMVYLSFGVRFKVICSTILRS